ncbi:thiol:disulfide interchange protein DsbA/DsbL [Kitasatospora sp. NPDC049285]|uniref:thiol:disulfide interchange protein DsbA/DsbL n=1 Tax=Kitasatospora sp. NPDC049285 TaxID=3157096 RepID=UPI00342E2DA4
MKSLLRNTVLFVVAGGLLSAPAAAEAAPARPLDAHGPANRLLARPSYPGVGQPPGVSQQHAPVQARPLEPAQPGPRAERTHEAVEFFWYDCPHSAQLEQPLTRWAAQHGREVTLRRVPAVWPGDPDEAEQRAHARLFYTLERLGEVDRLQQSVFDAVREQHLDLTTEQAAAAWAVRHGVDEARFRAAYGSAEVGGAVDGAAREFAREGINELPTVLLDGAGRTSPSRAGGVEQMPSALDRLVSDANRG